MNGWMDGWIYGWMKGRVDGWIGGDFLWLLKVCLLSSLCCIRLNLLCPWKSFWSQNHKTIYDYIHHCRLVTYIDLDTSQLPQLRDCPGRSRPASHSP
jgi:hypothetical protein